MSILRHTTASSLLHLLLLLGAVMTGCTRTIEVQPTTATSAHPSSHAIAGTERVPLIVDAVKVTLNGAPQNPPLELDRRILGSLQELRLFSQVSSFDTIRASGHEKEIVAHLSIEDTVDSHPGTAAWKGVVIGASMFLLAPVMDLHYDYGTTLTLELERWDGSVKTYQASSNGRARYNLFAASPDMIAELKGKVLDTGLTHLLEQVANDTAFYAASSAPDTERTIYSVGVKPKRRMPAALSVSTSGTADAR